MGHEKEQQERDDSRVRINLDKCKLCDSPVEGYPETLCYGCRTNLDKDK